MEKKIIAIGCGKSAKSPVMPFIGERFDGEGFSRLCEKYLIAALCRCGIDTVECPCGVDPTETAIFLNRRNVDALVTVSYGAFGSGKSFNAAHGFNVYYANGRTGEKSRTLGEDICAKLMNKDRSGSIAPREYYSVGCPIVDVQCGYSTCFEEAKLICDPDFAVENAERIALGICEFFGTAYTLRDDITAYAPIGKPRRGTKVKMLQALLCANGYELECDGIFGQAADARVKAFCADNGEPVTVGVTPAVWRKLLLLDPCEVRFGAKGSAVRYIQRKLRSKLYPVEIDGVFGKDTLDALNAFLSETVGGGACIAETDCVDKDILKLLTPIGGGRPQLY